MTLIWRNTAVCLCHDVRVCVCVCVKIFQQQVSLSHRHILWTRAAQWCVFWTHTIVDKFNNILSARHVYTAVISDKASSTRDHRYIAGFFHAPLCVTGLLLSDRLMQGLLLCKLHLWCYMASHQHEHQSVCPVQYTALWYSVPGSSGAV